MKRLNKKILYCKCGKPIARVLHDKTSKIYASDGLVCATCTWEKNKAYRINYLLINVITKGR